VGEMAFEIADIPFQFVTEIVPELDRNGKPKEYMPQSQYKNISKIPLNKFGKGPFCRFKIPDNYRKSGVYLVLADGLPVYVGECEDLTYRYNSGYGHISPRKCYKRGQSTNCRVNTLILESFKRGSKITLFFYETENRYAVESDLIARLRPKWNKSTGKSSLAQIKTPTANMHPRYAGKPRISRFHKLEEYLRSSKNYVEALTYRSIEEIIGSRLPPSAYKHRAWWANTGHPHARSWSSVGWRVTLIDLGKSITFRKILSKTSTD